MEVSAVVLTGRQGADTDEKRAFIADLEKTGAIVRAVACDSADPNQVRQLLAMISRELPPLKGFIHSAAAHYRPTDHGDQSSTIFRQ